MGGGGTLKWLLKDYKSSLSQFIYVVYSYYTVIEKLLVYLMKQSFFEFFMLEE